MPAPAPDHPTSGLQRTIVVLVVVFVLDLFVLGQGVFAILIGAVGAVVLAAAAVFASDAQRRRGRAIGAALSLTLVLASVLTMRLHRWTAETAGARIVAACEAYRDDTGALPETLDALVPTYLPSIPVTRYTVIQWPAWYLVSEDPARHQLVVVVFPPFSRRVYSFEEGRWTSLD